MRAWLPIMAHPMGSDLMELESDEFCVTRGCGNFKLPGMTVCWEHAEQAFLIRTILERLDKLDDRVGSATKIAITALGTRSNR